MYLWKVTGHGRSNINAIIVIIIIIYHSIISKLAKKAVQGTLVGALFWGLSWVHPFSSSEINSLFLHHLYLLHPCFLLYFQLPSVKNHHFCTMSCFSFLLIKKTIFSLSKHQGLAKLPSHYFF